jgi:hypothetical protein
MQTIGLELPIARRRVSLVVDHFDDYFQRPGRTGLHAATTVRGKSGRREGPRENAEFLRCVWDSGAPICKKLVAVLGYDCIRG